MPPETLDHGGLSPLYIVYPLLIVHRVLSPPTNIFLRHRIIPLPVHILLTLSISQERSVGINCFLVVAMYDLVGAERPAAVSDSADIAPRIGLADRVQEFSTRRQRTSTTATN